MRARSAIAAQIRVRRPRSPCARGPLDVAPLVEPERNAAEHEGVEPENDERVGLVRQGPGGEVQVSRTPIPPLPDYLKEVIEEQKS